MGKGPLQIKVWQIPAIMETWEIVGIAMDAAGCWHIVGRIGPYLTKEEAEGDLPNISEKSFK